MFEDFCFELYVQAIGYKESMSYMALSMVLMQVTLKNKQFFCHIVDESLNHCPLQYIDAYLGQGYIFLVPAFFQTFYVTNLASVSQFSHFFPSVV